MFIVQVAENLLLGPLTQLLLKRDLAILRNAHTASRSPNNTTSTVSALHCHSKPLENTAKSISPYHRIKHNSTLMFPFIIKTARTKSTAIHVGILSGN